MKPPPMPRRVNATTGEETYDCPLCGDVKGHCQLNPAKGLWHCYLCDKGGTIKRLRYLTGIEWPLAVEDVAATATIQEMLFGVQPSAPKPRGVDYALLSGMPWTVGPEAQRVAGLGQPGTLLPLCLVEEGWWSSTGPVPSGPWGKAVQAARYLYRRRYKKKEATAWGLYVCTDPAAGRWYQRIVWPGWAPMTGLFRGCQARTYLDPCPSSVPRYLGPRVAATACRLLYSPDALAQAVAGCLDALVLVEGPMDAMAVSQVGCPVAALLGKHLAPKAVVELVSLGVRRVTLLLDSDVSEAQQLGMAGVLRQAGIEVRGVVLAAGDPDTTPRSDLKRYIFSAPKLGQDTFTAYLLRS